MPCERQVGTARAGRQPQKHTSWPDRKNLLGCCTRWSASSDTWAKPGQGVPPSSSAPGGRENCAPTTLSTFLTSAACKPSGVKRMGYAACSACISPGASCCTDRSGCSTGLDGQTAADATTSAACCCASSRRSDYHARIVNPGRPPGTLKLWLQSMLRDAACES